MNSRPPDQRHAFICGLHRSGTTLIALALGRHPMVSGFKNTGVIEDEGQFLQTVLPLEISFGGVGRFGFDPRAHMTEASPLNTPESASRLLSEWGRYWDGDKPVLTEKTPSNLLRMRLLQALAPSSHFIIVTRHPIATSLATLKWTEGSLFSLFSHWVHCHRIARDDAKRIKRALWVSYEAFVKDPARQLARIAEFLNLPLHPGWAPAVTDENEKYFALWRTRYCGDFDRAIEQLPPEHPRSLLTRARERLARNARERSLPLYRRRENRRDFYDALDAAAHFEPALAEFGYSFTDLSRFPEGGRPQLFDVACESANHDAGRRLPRFQPNRPET
jgi:hypothetical protein